MSATSNCLKIAVLISVLCACKAPIAKDASGLAEKSSSAAGKTASPIASSAHAPIESTGTASSAPSTASYVKSHGILLLETGKLGQPPSSSSIFSQRGDGTGRLDLTGPSNIQPSWTPDGRIIFVSYEGTTPQVYTMNDTGGDRKQIGQLTLQGVRQPQLGKNGLVVFAAQGGIWKMKQDGTGLALLVDNDNVAAPSLALSGTWITYTQETKDPYHREIWRINTDGTGKKQLTFTGDPDYPDGNASMISPDESMIAVFTGKESDAGLAGFTQSIFTFGHRNVGIMSSNGGAITLVTDCQPVTTQAQLDSLGSDVCFAADDPTWSPDSQWVIYSRGTKSGVDTWMVDIHGEQAQQIYDDSRGYGRMIMRFATDSTSPAPQPQPPSSASLCPALPAGAPADLAGLCQQVSQLGSIHYPVGPIASEAMLRAALADQIQQGNFDNAKAILQMVLQNAAGAVSPPQTQGPFLPSATAEGDFLGLGYPQFVAAFPGQGVYLWSQTGGWTKIGDATPSQLQAGNFLGASLGNNNATDIAAVVPNVGVFIWSKATGWIKVDGGGAPAQ